MDPAALLEQYLTQQHMVQLATVAEGQPWCCTVYYVHDPKHNLYWASLPTRRHSQEIAQHGRVAAAIPIKHVKGEPVAGLQFAGQAVMIEPESLDRPVVVSYAAKFGRDKQWVEDFLAGSTEHRLYKLTPSEIVMFDEVHFAGNPRLKLL